MNAGGIIRVLVSKSGINKVVTLVVLFSAVRIKQVSVSLFHSLWGV
jgi:hypothetical protein